MWNNYDLMAGADAMSVIQVFDRRGLKIAEVLASCNRAWVRNGIARAVFTLSIFDAKCREDVLRYGNMVLIEHQKLPAWGGVIDPPREWRNGQVTITAYDGLRLFGYRVAQREQLLRGSAAVLIRKIYELAQQDMPLPIEIGVLEDDDHPREETVGGNPLLDDLIRIVERANGVLQLTPMLSMGRMRFRVDYHTNPPTTMDILYLDNHNLRVEGQTLVEQGAIVNDMLGLGDGLTWDSRPRYREVDEDSINLYGLRQGVLHAQGVTQIGTLTRGVKAALALSRQPEMVLDLQVVDVGDAWSRLRPMAPVRVRLTSAGFIGDKVGFQATGRVVGMEYNEAAQSVRVVLEVENE
jgi:hypothetical protein